MKSLQELWTAYLIENGSNNMMLNKVRRTAFMAGGRAVRDEINQELKFKHLVEDPDKIPPLYLVPGDDDE